MMEHWTGKLTLHGSLSLASGWRQFEQSVRSIEDGLDQWLVVQLPTGSGKTEALKMLCAMPDPLDHPGALIITKFRDEADKIADGINELAGRTVAVSDHMMSRGNTSEIGFMPVLVTTQAAYRLSLQEIADTGLRTRSDRLLAFGGGRRSWLIIDEAFEWADCHSINVGNMRAMSGDLSRAMNGELRTDAELLLHFSLRLTDGEGCGRSDRAVPADATRELARIDLQGLRNAVSASPADAFQNYTENRPATENEQVLRTEASLKTQYLDQIDAVMKIVRIGHAWVSSRGAKTMLHSARSLIGLDGMRGVVLDATAGIDPTYELMGEQVHLLPRPEGIRSYRNVTLHVSHGHRVGKQALAQNAAREWPRICAELSGSLAGKQVLVCVHKIALETVRQYGLAGAAVHYTNWGNLDGRNDWDGCETMIVFGLPYLDDIEPAQRVTAHRGALSDAWFGGDRRCGRHDDIRTALSDGFIARSVVQALNRTRCRRPIDADGNCAATDIYLLLPKGKTGEVVMRAVEQQMPGIRIKAWNSHATMRKARRIPTETKLAAFFDKAESGCYPKSEIVRTLRITGSGMDRMTAKIRDGSSWLASSLQGAGVHYHTQTGRGREAYFTKD
jgi:hypothetical protein